MFPENGLHFLDFASTELFLLGGTVQKSGPQNSHSTLNEETHF